MAWLTLALLIVCAGILRFTQLTAAPAGGQGDVSWVGINALDWVDRGVWPFYVRELYAPEFFPVYITGLLLPLTGISQLPQRIMTATSGVLLVPALFWAAWWLLAEFEDRRRVWGALAAAGAGALSFHATFLSRLGMESPPFILTVTLFAGATAWAWQRGGWRRWLLAGFLLGLNQYIYLPARLLPVVFALWMGYLLLTQRARLRQQLRGLVIAVIVALIVTLPAIILFIQTPATFSARADQGTQITGGWIWLYDTTKYGGVAGLILQKIGLTIKGIGVTWQAEYSVLGQPMLAPLFFAGFVVAVILTLRYRRSIAFAWCWLAIPPLIITDLISGGVPIVHALHQMGILPFIFLLSGIGLGFALDWLARFVRSRALQVALIGGLALVAVVPTASVFARYLDVYTPDQLAQPDFYWSGAQADLDMARYMDAHKEQTFLLPISEYTRSDVAWFVADGFRYRQSAISADGQLDLPPLPDQITVVMPTYPERPRHDGHTAHFNLDQWVLLQNGTIYFLPMLSTQATQTLSNALINGSVTPLIDTSSTDIAHFITISRPDLFPSAQPIIEHPLDATFDDTIKLVGYSTNNTDIQPGAYVDVTLYFQALKPIPEDYDVFAQLWTDGKDSVAQSEEAPYSGMYRSRIWQTNEIVPVHLWLQAPSNLAYGRYTLVMGLYRALKGQRVSVSGANAMSGDEVAAAPDFRYTPPFADADTSGLASDTFDNTLKLAVQSAQGDDAALTGDHWQIKAGATINLNLIWQALQPPTQDYSIFLHLTAANDAKPLAQTDTLIRADYPTGAWRPNDQFAQMLTLTLPADLPSGSYDLVAGVYQWQSGARLTISAGSNTLPDNRVRLAQIQVSVP
ncbi:MAG TPA: hypothetical protein VHD90_03545 [Phototrophicaceae bacterium]|nr:hypothetical protein [Phototrophicaceae bacterium]